MPKYKQIAAALRAQISDGVLAAGAVLPSYRRLMEEHGATVSVVRQAMQELQTEGIVVSVPRVGCRVAPPGDARSLIGVVIFGWYPNRTFRADQIKELHDEFDRLHCDVAIRIVEKPDPAALDACCAWARRLQGVLLTGRVSVVVARRLLETGVPLVQVGELTDGPAPAGLSLVTVDVQSLTRLAVSHLAARGHRRIALDAGRGSRYFETLRAAFRDCMRECGLEAGCIEPDLEEEWPAVGAIVRALDTMQEPPTAILVEGSGYATELIDALNCRGWSVPERVSILAIGETAQTPYAREGLSCVLSATRELNLRAVEILHAQLRSPLPIVTIERLSACFLPGLTCRRIDFDD